MALSSASGPDDRTLQRYLLGALTVEETEQLDELSIVDSEFALRLGAVEHDLVDSYVKGELSGEALDRFKSHYLPVSVRRGKVDFAETFNADEPATHGAAEDGMVWPRPSSTFLTSRWLAVAAMVILAAALYLLIDDLRLRRDAVESHNTQATLQARQRQLEQQLDAQRSVASDAAQELARLRESQADLQGRQQVSPPSKPSVLSLMLLPAMRDVASLPTIRVPRGTGTIALRLRLDADDFSSYRAVLKEAAGGRVIWSSGTLHAVKEGTGMSVPIAFDARLLQPKAYVVEVGGITAPGALEPIATYPFRVVIE